ncbi:hypothetical protein F4778DRAFT_743479 [Xylariomycetidae sp. FL2044]|nr:hypothetical protein F4778DRAFT_743479 [Xylariomycetidae sp. FL2044]
MVRLLKYAGASSMLVAAVSATYPHSSKAVSSTAKYPATSAYPTIPDDEDECEDEPDYPITVTSKPISYPNTTTSAYPSSTPTEDDDDECEDEPTSYPSSSGFSSYYPTSGIWTNTSVPAYPTTSAYPTTTVYPTGGHTEYTTITSTSTITACPPTVTKCPIGSVTTVTVTVPCTTEDSYPTSTPGVSYPVTTYPPYPTGSNSTAPGVPSLTDTVITPPTETLPPVTLPSFTGSEVPSVTLPSFTGSEVPSVTLPSFTGSEVPSVTLPSFTGTIVTSTTAAPTETFPSFSSSSSSPPPATSTIATAGAPGIGGNGATGALVAAAAFLLF